MNRALTLLTLVCGLALTVPASAAPVKTASKPAVQSTVKRVHHKRVMKHVARKHVTARRVHHKRVVKHVTRKHAMVKKPMSKGK